MRQRDVVAHAQHMARKAWEQRERMARAVRQNARKHGAYSEESRAVAALIRAANDLAVAVEEQATAPNRAKETSGLH